VRTIIYLTRHGLSEHNLRSEVYMGRSPASRLVAEGREQARRLGGRLARNGPVDRIVCSSLPRARETAELIAAALGLATVEEEDAFWELSKGAWEGVMPRQDLPPHLARALRDDPFGFRYPGGESFRDVTARALPAFERRVRDHAGERLLFVLHGDVLRALLHGMLRFPPGKIGDFVIHPCSLTELTWESGRYLLVRFNDDSHLAPDESPTGDVQEGPG
jgi:broad specificity phosphatase PhoE